MEVHYLNSKTPSSVKCTSSLIRVFQRGKQEKRKENEEKEKDPIKFYIYYKIEVQFQKC